MTNKKQIVAKWIVGLMAGGMAVAMTPGCQSHCCTPIAHGEDFAAPGTPTSVGRLSQSQAAAGAKEDGTLGTQHFAQGQLNSLGQVKLDLILKGSPANAPVVVYLDLPKSAAKDSQGSCKEAVTNYLETAGVPLAQIQVVDGPNTTVMTPTAYTLPTIYRQDGTSYSGQAADALTSTDVSNAGSAGATGGTH